jgi:hypothetical protein
MSAFASCGHGCRSGLSSFVPDIAPHFGQFEWHT